MKVFQTTCTLAILLFSTLIFAQGELSEEQQIGSVSEIEFESNIFNFGEIESGEFVQTVFRFTNTSDEPLIINNAKGSCGCTVPEWPKEPIKPGESGQFVVRFNSKNKVGVQSKRVTITANTEPAISYLTIKGEVIQAADNIDGKADEATLLSKEIQKRDYDIADVMLYPNPASEQLNVQIKNNDTLATVYVFDSTGSLIDSQVTTDQNEVIFDVSSYESGLYTVSVKSENLHRIAKQVSIIQN